MKTARLGLLMGLCMLMGATSVYAACDDLHNHQLITLQGEKLNLCDYQDKPVLIVNTASKCGFTPQFEKLESLYTRNKSKGLLVVGFPSNDFHQEPGGNKEIGEFCKKTYAVQFPMMAKSSVVGPNANPLHKQLAAVTHEAPMWNFYKYLILPNGTVYAFSSDVDPESAQVVDKIKPFLK